ncbi:MAG: LCP family protein [Candidatus Eremiobacteraeota bacterium]|nr:LCP family protein [Candidatus Eremiobacteraeota bacterium]
MSKQIVADPPVPPAPPNDDRPRRRSDPPPGGAPPSRWRNVLAYVLAFALIVVGVVCGFVAYRVFHDHQPMPTTFSEIFIPSPSSVFGKERIYVLLLGTDYNRDEKGMPYSKGARSDTIMAAGLDFPSKSLKLVSILRDSDATVNGHETKINEAYSQGGVKLADAVIGDFLTLPRSAKGSSFDRYLVINPRGLKDFVDAIGGIDVPVTETMDYDDSWGDLHIHFKPGMYHMNGQKAMEYSRYRHDACSDSCRVKRQQQIIHIAMTKLKSQKFNDLLHIGALLNALNKNVKTNLTFDEEKSLAWHFRDANLADLSKAATFEYTATKDTPYGGEVVIPDPAQKAKVLADFLGAYGNVTPPPQSALQSIKPSTVHVVVQNGSGVSGLAGAVSAKLEKLHYVVDSVTNADTFGYDVTQIRPATAIPFLGERVRADLGVPGAVVAPATDTTPGPHTVVTVIVGKDYASPGIVPVPTSSAAPAPPR